MLSLQKKKEAPNISAASTTNVNETVFASLCGSKVFAKADKTMQTHAALLAVIATKRFHIAYSFNSLRFVNTRIFAMGASVAALRLEEYSHAHRHKSKYYVLDEGL